MLTQSRGYCIVLALIVMLTQGLDFIMRAPQSHHLRQAECENLIIVFFFLIIYVENSSVECKRLGYVPQIQTTPLYSNVAD